MRVAAIAPLEAIVGFYRHCKHGCVYDDPNEGRVRLDAPTLREKLTDDYRCWKCGERQPLDEDDRRDAMNRLLDIVEGLGELLRERDL